MANDPYVIDRKLLLLINLAKREKDDLSSNRSRKYLSLKRRINGGKRIKQQFHGFEY